MAINRLKTMRKVFGKNQSEIAKVVSITQNAYSYWENGKVNIDSESLKKLASYYNVSLDFLSGREFKLTRTTDSWTKDQQAEYYTSNDHKKTYLEYLWGAPVFIDDEEDDTDTFSVPQKTAIKMFLTEREAELLEAYRAQPHMQIAVDRLLGLNEDGIYTVYAAAKSNDNHPPRIIQKSKGEWEAIMNAKETDDPLI